LTTLGFILAMTAAVAASATVTALIVRKGVHKKISFMLDALEDGETNFRFSERMRPGRGLNKTLNRIRTIFRKERHQIMEQEKYYGQMLDNVKTGVIVSAVKGEEVLYCNKRALSLLGFSSLSTLRQLKKISPEVYTAFSWVDEDSPQKAGFFSDKSPCNISIAATRTLMQGNEVKIITFNDISGEIEDNEVTSWTRLIRVLTHEIMNTVTPIASLSEVLQTCVDDPAKKDDLKAGLETISTSSRGLVKFVESYRNLTRVANPVKKAFFVRDMAAKVIDLTSAFGAEVTFVEKTEDVLLYADEGQISQILVNLVKNAAQAGGAQCRDISRDRLRRLGDCKRIQRRSSHKRTGKRGDLHSFLHDKAGRYRNRPQPFPPDNETARRHPAPDALG